jgi:hypothetical protein
MQAFDQVSCMIHVYLMSLPAVIWYEDGSAVLVLVAPAQQGRRQVRHKVQDPPLISRAVAAPDIQPRRLIRIHICRIS